MSDIKEALDMSECLLYLYVKINSRLLMSCKGSRGFLQRGYRSGIFSSFYRDCLVVFYHMLFVSDILSGIYVFQKAAS